MVNCCFFVHFDYDKNDKKYNKMASKVSVFNFPLLL